MSESEMPVPDAELTPEQRAAAQAADAEKAPGLPEPAPVPVGTEPTPGGVDEAPLPDHPYPDGDQGDGTFVDAGTGVISEAPDPRGSLGDRHDTIGTALETLRNLLNRLPAELQNEAHALASVIRSML